MAGDGLQKGRTVFHRKTSVEAADDGGGFCLQVGGILQIVGIEKAVGQGGGGMRVRRKRGRKPRQHGQNADFLNAPPPAAGQIVLFLKHTILDYTEKLGLEIPKTEKNFDFFCPAPFFLVLTLPFPPPLPFPPSYSIPAKAGISRGGIVRHASPQATLHFRFAEFPADAGRDSRFRGNGRGGRKSEIIWRFGWRRFRPVFPQ